MNDKVLMMRNGKTVWGPAPKTELPEGYPYKEQSETVLLAEQTVTFGNGQATCIIETEIAPDKTYRVTWDGQTETVTAVVATDFGASAKIPFGEKFILYANDGGAHVLIVADPTMPETATIGISELSETIHPMAPEFIQLTSPNGTKYQLTVADDGTLSAVAVS